VLWLEFKRRWEHWTQEELGRRIGRSQVRVSEWERGLRPTPADLRSLAGVFGIPAANAEGLLHEVPANIAEVPPPPSLNELFRGGQP
jgi:transcriptional regulator with XRE-family HTH domain